MRRPDGSNSSGRRTHIIVRAPELKLVHPEEAKMLLFPSNMGHRSFPLDEDSRRIAIDFEPLA